MLKTRILLAEDDLDDQEFFSDFMQDRDDVILMPIVENGESVIQLLDSIVNTDELPHIIVLDQNMPKMNGLQTLQHLKNSERYARIPVCIYSTYTDETLIKNGSALGACVVLSKPFSKEGYDQMIDTLCKACGSSKMTTTKHNR
ncbi:response regulator [Chitinophagaceae bacterium LB-8]|jgi:CheY-like chemotaxis protein|uniref:Response regulator n=1 Tax=Paraflavisolibacter caeni TaxID=2982496 RepID=A0A9X2XWF5_9BACT|nr:response regulator [Paraflavisolibacter caeni]MCU7549897.1 response regulator [Paraflavisolibacter caeni]